MASGLNDISYSIKDLVYTDSDLAVTPIMDNPKVLHHATVLLFLVF